MTVSEISRLYGVFVMTYEEFIAYAKTHYNNGGDGFFECWDRMTFDYYVSEFGEITKRKALKMFRLAKSESDEISRTAW